MPFISALRHGHCGSSFCQTVDGRCGNSRVSVESMEEGGQYIQGGQGGGTCQEMVAEHEAFLLAEV
jgi:hypothetical protein